MGLVGRSVCFDSTREAFRDDRIDPTDQPAAFQMAADTERSTRMKKRFFVVLSAFGALAVTLSLVIPHALPSALALLRPDLLFSIPTSSKTVFITIDDAPSAATKDILQVLKKHGVPATFFVVSDRVSAVSQLEEIVREKHALGNHLQTTKACTKLTLSEFQTSFDECAALLQSCTTPRFFRPASDFGTQEQIAYARSRGCQAVVGTIFPLDHWISDRDWLVRTSRWLAVSGGIVILHDGPVRGQTTAAVLERLIPKLRSAGFSFSRLEEAVTGPSLPPMAKFDNQLGAKEAGAYQGTTDGSAVAPPRA